MARNNLYNGGLTAEQFLFHEIRVASKFFIEGTAMEEAAEIIRRDNLFQFPTEREVKRMTKACYKRLAALENDNLVHEIAYGPTEDARQVNLYAIMRYNGLVWDFMVHVIGEKYRNQDFGFSRKDINGFFDRLQAQNDQVDSWSDRTIGKIKSVLVKMLVETEYLDDIRSDMLNPVFLCEELETGIRENGDFEALPAFNCLR